MWILILAPYLSWETHMGWLNRSLGSRSPWAHSWYASRQVIHCIFAPSPQLCHRDDRMAHSFTTGLQPRLSISHMNKACVLETGDLVSGFSSVFSVVTQCFFFLWLTILNIVLVNEDPTLLKCAKSIKIWIYHPVYKSIFIPNYSIHFNYSINEVIPVTHKQGLNCI